MFRHKTKQFSIERLITHLRIEEESRKQNQKDEVLVIFKNKKKFGVVQKPNGKPIKNHNSNVVSQIKNEIPLGPQLLQLLDNIHHLKEMTLLFSLTLNMENRVP